MKCDVVSGNIVTSRSELGLIVCADGQVGSVHCVSAAGACPATWRWWASTGTELPDLSLNGRAGHYRIRVHFAWFPWDGDKYGTQRLLIMAYPGPGDKVVTYRRPAKGR